jgi:hypothetical protein
MEVISQFQLVLRLSWYIVNYANIVNILKIFPTFLTSWCYAAERRSKGNPFERSHLYGVLFAKPLVGRNDVYLSLF